MEPLVEVISKPYHLAEGPFWDQKTHALYFVDIRESTVNKYVPTTGVHTSAKVGDKTVSIIIPVKGYSNRFVISYGGDLATINWDGQSEEVSDLEIIAKIDPRNTNRINDGKVNPQGNAIFLGSMPDVKVGLPHEKRKSSFYCYTNAGRVIELLQNISISNGLTWTLDGTKLYYIDTFRFKITRYDCDLSANPILSNETIVYKMDNVRAGLDGMTIDVEGKLWVAVFGACCVLRVDPDTGNVLKKITLPSKNITSVTFGGVHLDELFVTSAYCDLSEEERLENKHSGCLFKISGLGVRGREDVPFDLI